VKIAGSLNYHGSKTANVQLSILKIEKNSDLELYCELEFEEPIKKTVKIYGIDEENVIFNCVKFVLTLIK
jgi:hypothetical protein